MNNKTPKLVAIMFLTVITAVVWAGTEVYRSLTTKPSIEVDQNVSAPLDPSLDQNILDSIENRINPDTSTTTTQLLLLQTATPSAQPTSSPEVVQASPTPSSTVSP